MDNKELKMRTKQFALRCIKMSSALPDTSLGKHIRGQIIRSSTSVAANYRATCLSYSKASFTAKLSVVLEETDESAFWLEFIMDEKLLKKNLVDPLLTEARELTAIFASSRKTASKK